MTEDKNPGRAFIELSKHTLLVTAAFLVIFAVAIGIDLLSRYLVTRGILTSDSPLQWALIGPKYFLLVIDLYSFWSWW